MKNINIKDIHFFIQGYLLKLTLFTYKEILSKTANKNIKNRVQDISGKFINSTLSENFHETISYDFLFQNLLLHINFQRSITLGLAEEIYIPIYS